MAEKQTFKTVLKKHEKLDATGIELPFDVEAIFGAKHVAVKAVINRAEYRGSIVRMGGKYMLGIPKAFREAAGINAGDEITVSVEKDVEEKDGCGAKRSNGRAKKSGAGKGLGKVELHASQRARPDDRRSKTGRDAGASDRKSDSDDRC